MPNRSHDIRERWLRRRKANNAGEAMLTRKAAGLGYELKPTEQMATKE